MKSGVFAGEPLERILERKLGEVRDLGRFFWGYGGSICHPRSQLVPHAQAAAASGGLSHLVMSHTTSQLHQDAKPATEFSRDGVSWEPLPSGINVLGSRFAVVCGAPKQVNYELDLSRYRVSIGPSAGRLLSDYIRARVDKACAQLDEALASCGPRVRIFWQAPVVEPYAVLLR